MTPSEREDLSLFNAGARQRVALEVGCSLPQVDDCISKYLWMQQMTEQLRQRRRAGHPMPTSVAELESLMGTFHSFKQSTAMNLTSQGGAGCLIPVGRKGWKGEPCPLAGHTVSKRYPCPASKKQFKRCCGADLLQ